jgi:hypothetical protein
MQQCAGCSGMQGKTKETSLDSTFTAPTIFKSGVAPRPSTGFERSKASRSDSSTRAMAGCVGTATGLSFPLSDMRVLCARRARPSLIRCSLPPTPDWHAQ